MTSSTNKLRVALLTSSRVPVKKYGGTEREVVWLAQELIRQGHTVTLVARTGSYVPGMRMIFADSHDEAFARIPADIDIVHSHHGAPPRVFQLPWLATTHGNGRADR